MIRKRTQAREFAVQILYQLELNPETVEETLAGFWRENASDAEIREFTERLVRGTHEKISQLDQVLDRYTDNWTLKRLATVDRNILRLGAYEILFMEDIPPKVSINEAVNIAKKYSQIDSGKFVNGVLDKINHTEKPVG